MTRPTDLTVRDAGPVRTICFDRPERLNALREQTLDELAAAVRDLDQTTRVLVITGRGTAFSAGQDLDELGRQLDAAAQLDADALTTAARASLERTQQITRDIIDGPAISIAALNGVAVGFGAELAVNCDLRIGCDATRIGFVESTRALCHTNGVFHLLPRLIGHGHAADLLLGGHIIDGRRAHQIGLTTRHVTDDELDDTVAAIADELATRAPISIALAKRGLRLGWEGDLEASLDFEIDGMVRCLHSDDLVEGTRAFVEGRTPAYTGR